jgi:hypothetical protein
MAVEAKRFIKTFFRELKKQKYSLGKAGEKKAGKKDRHHRGHGGCPGEEGQRRGLRDLPGIGRRLPSTLVEPCQGHSSEDRYCLARSIALGLAWYRFGCNRKALGFRQFVADRDEQQTEAAVELLRAAGCRLGKRFYGYEDIDRIQPVLDRIYGRLRCRVVVLDANRRFRVRYRSQEAPTPNDICLILVNRHYLFIGEPRFLFRVIFLFLTPKIIIEILQCLVF